MNKERKFVSDDLHEISLTGPDIDYHSIDEIIKILTDIKNRYPSDYDIKVESEINYGTFNQEGKYHDTDQIEFRFYNLRLENDREYEARLEREREAEEFHKKMREKEIIADRKREEEQIKKDRETFENLKTKYNW